jgi:hypothetical protein
MDGSRDGSQRWSWRWAFDGDPPGALRRWLFALVAALVGVVAVVATGAREAAPLAVAAIFAGQVLWQPFVSVSRLDGQLRGGGRGGGRAREPVPRRPLGWYRVLLWIAVAWAAADLLVLVAVARIGERGFWWFLALGSALVMLAAAAVSATAAWRVQRALAGTA